MTTNDKINLLKARGYEVDFQLETYFVVLNPKDEDFYRHGNELALDEVLALPPVN